MKTSYHHIAAAVILAGLAACSIDEDNFRPEPDDEGPGLITISGEISQIYQTRANDSGFADKDEIGVYIVDYNGGDAGTLKNNGNRADNVKFTFDEAAYKWTPEHDIYWKDKETHIDVCGYYPYANPSSVEEYRFSVATDQTTSKTAESLGGYEASDFLWAKQAGVKYPDVVNLTFSHKMSRLVVKLVKGKDFEGDIPKDVVVKVHGTVTDAIVDLGSGVVVKDSHGKAESITMKKESESVFSSIIVPQRIDNRQPLIEVLTSNVSYLMESRFIFRSGIQHSINIILDSDPAKVKIEIGGEIQGWN